MGDDDNPVSGGDALAYEALVNYNASLRKQNNSLKRALQHRRRSSGSGRNNKKKRCSKKMAKITDISQSI